MRRIAAGCVVIGTLAVVSGCNLGAKVVIYEVPGGLSVTATGEPLDVNADGRSDFIVGSAVLFGDGTGAFTTAAFTSAPSGGGGTSTFVRVDDDPYVDIIVADNIEISVQFGDGTGNFTRELHVAETDGFDFEIVAGDVNADGATDFATIHGVQQSRVFLGDGSGAFADPIPLESPLYFITEDGVIEDVDGDGDTDIVSHSSWSQAGQVSTFAVWRGDGTGHFSTPTLLGDGAIHITFRDVNQDGLSDAFGTHLPEEHLPAWLQLADGTGGFGEPILLPDEVGFPTDVGDFDGDGEIDLVGLPRESRATTIWFGADGYQFEDPHGLSGGAMTTVDDLDGDGKPDLIVATDETVQVYLNKLTGRPGH